MLWPVVAAGDIVAEVGWMVVREEETREEVEIAESIAQNTAGED